MLQFGITLSNAKFGTAILDDFTVVVSGPSPSPSFSAGDPSESTAVMVAAGVTYAVTVAGPAGYDIARSPECSGVSAPGRKTCVITIKEAPVTCDDNLWSPVYLRDRLRVMSTCEAASGFVRDVGLEPDGDLVLELQLDPPYTGLMRPGNFSDPSAHNHLVVEVPCQTPPTEPVPSAACAQFTGQRIAMPPMGSHLVAAAHWVEDRNHSFWGELHGARIIMLPR